MNINNRIYTYPVLSDDTDCYCESKFDVDMKCTKNGVKNIHFEFDIKMDNSEIEELISNRMAEYIFHMECASTSYRKVFKSISYKTEIDVSTDDIEGKLEIVALIVAKKNIKGFVSKDWTEDYYGLKFDFDKGTIIGYKNFGGIELIKDYNEFENTSSIFTIQKVLTKNTPFDVNMDGDQIKILLCEDDYEVFSKLYNSNNFKTIAINSIILPSLVYIFEQLSYEDMIAEYSSRVWYKYLEESYRKRGLDLEDEIISEDISSLKLAQDAMELPLKITLNNLKEIYDDTGYEED